MTKFLENIDNLADDEAPIHRINMDGNTKYKSSLGGFCTLTIVIAFLAVCIILGGDVISKKYPFTTIREVQDYYQSKVPLSDHPTIFFAIKDAAKIYKLDRTKIDVYINNVVLTFYKNGTLSSQRQRFEFKECTLQDFKTEFEKKAFQSEQTLYRDLSWYCVDDPDDGLFLYGNVDSFTIRKGQAITMVAIQIDTCNKPQMTNVANYAFKAKHDHKQKDYECSSDNEIQEWRKGKYLRLETFGNLMDLNPKNKEKFRQSILEIKAVPLFGHRSKMFFNNQKYEVTVYENMFYEFNPKLITFYDYNGLTDDEVFNTKDLDLEKSEYQFLKYDLGVIYIQNGPNIVVAEIKVVTYIDLLTKVAGVPSFLFLVYRYCLSEFERFYSDVQICQSFQKNSKNEEKIDKKQTENYQHFTDFSLSSQLRVFLFYENPVINFLRKILCGFRCCKKKKFKTKIEKVKELSAIISDKLDLKKILIQIHNFDLNLKCLFKKFNLKILYEDEFNIMEKWMNKYHNNSHTLELTKNNKKKEEEEKDKVININKKTVGKGNMKFKTKIYPVFIKNQDKKRQDNLKIEEEKDSDQISSMDDKKLRLV